MFALTVIWDESAEPRLYGFFKEEYLAKGFLTAEADHRNEQPISAILYEQTCANLKRFSVVSYFKKGEWR